MFMRVGTWLMFLSPLYEEGGEAVGLALLSLEGRRPPAERMLGNRLARRKMHLWQSHRGGWLPFLCTWGMARLGAVGKGIGASKGHGPLARMGCGPWEEGSLSPRKGTSSSCLKLYPTPLALQP